MTYQTIYTYDDSGEEKEIGFPLIKKDGNDWIEDENGQLHQFTVTLNDRQLGLLKYKRIEILPDPLPQPHDPEREKLIAELDNLLRRIPNYQVCLKRRPVIRQAIDKKFAGFSSESVSKLIELAEAELEQQKAEAKALEPPPQFERYDLTISFRGQMIGDLFIDEIYELGTAANSWNTRWLCHCTGCEQGEPASRIISSQTILQMKVGFTPKYTCQKPCKKKGKK